VWTSFFFCFGLVAASNCIVEYSVMDGAEGRSALKKAEDDEEETADDDHSHKK